MLTEKAESVIRAKYRLRKLERRQQALSAAATVAYVDAGDAAGAAALAAHSAAANPHPGYLTPAEGNAAYDALGAAAAAQAAAQAFATAADAALIVDSIADADTTHAPSRNAVFDALALKADVSSLAEAIDDRVAALLVAGTNIALTYNDGAGTLTIDASGGGGGGTWGSITGTLSAQTDLQTALDGKVDENTAITGATKTKITYDAKGLVTAGADATTADIADSLNKRYVTDANLTTLGLTSGTNTGDQTSIVGIAGTLAQFNTAITDADILSTSTAASTYQPLDATLTALAGANWAANAVPIGSGVDALSQVAFAANTFPGRSSAGNLVAKTITDFGFSLVDDADAAAGRTTLGLGTMATATATDYAALASSPSFAGSVTSTGASAGIFFANRTGTARTYAWYGDANTIRLNVSGTGDVITITETGGITTGGGIASAAIASTSTIAAASGFRATGTSAFGAGAGIELYYDASNGYVLSYDRTGAAFRPLILSGSTTRMDASGVTQVLADTVRTSFTNAARLIPSTAPGTPADGDIWYDSGLAKFRKREAGVTSDIGATGAAGTVTNFSATNSSGVTWGVATPTTTPVLSLAVATQAAGNNATNIATTAYVRSNTGMANYRTVAERYGSHVAARVAGTYAIPNGNPCAISGTGTLYNQGVFYFDPADYPAVDGVTGKLRIRGQVFCNDVAPTGNFTIGLHPVTRPATSGGAALAIFTVGAATAAATVVTAPAADSSNTTTSADFAMPAAGFYVLGVVTTATVAASAHTHISAQLQLRHA